MGRRRWCAVELFRPDRSSETGPVSRSRSEVHVRPVRFPKPDRSRPYGAERAILFGSWAKGTAREDSDVDVLFVKQTESSPLTRIHNVVVTFEIPTDVDVFVFTPSELEEPKDSRFVQTMLDGISL